MSIKDLKCERFRQEPVEVDDFIESFENDLSEDLPAHMYTTARCALKLLQNLSEDEVKIMNDLLAGEFNRGLSEGRDRERYEKND